MGSSQAAWQADYQVQACEDHPKVLVGLSGARPFPMTNYSV